MRVGTGYDVHRLTEGRKLILCGVDIPHEKGLLGHSDADVAVHAIMDALLGAAALGDIGLLFPDTDPAYEGVSSMELLAGVRDRLEEELYIIENIDCTIIAQRPKLRPYIEEMRQNLASVLGLEIGRVSVKATTEEGLGFTGSGEGIAAQAICCLQSMMDMVPDDRVMNLAQNGGSPDAAPCEAFAAPQTGRYMSAGRCAGCPGCPGGRTQPAGENEE